MLNGNGIWLEADLAVEDVEEVAEDEEDLVAEVEEERGRYRKLQLTTI